MRAAKIVGAGVVALVALLVPLGATAANAQTTGEQITDFTIAIDVQPDGALVVDEAITYDFGTNERHGIYRDLVTRDRYNDTDWRVYPISDVRVTADAGTPAAASISNEGDLTRIRIGDPNRTITGTHVYNVHYRVEGAMIAFGSHDELNWDVIGDQWPVPIAAASARVEMPANIINNACYHGQFGSTLPCTESAHTGNKASFGQAPLGPYEGMTAVVAIPAGTIQPQPEPILEKVPTVRNPFSVSRTTVSAAAAASVFLVACVLLLAWRIGRDRRYTGSAVDAAFGNADDSDERIPLGAKDAGPVEFIPPDGVRPGQVGTLVDEEVNMIDVTATIIDLAVRGWLTITEVEADGWGDYQLTRTDPGRGELLPYEAKLFNSLFAEEGTVMLFDLKYEFTSELAAVKKMMYDDVVERGWYRSRPDTTRTKWRTGGVVLAVAGLIAFVWLATKTSFGVLGLVLFFGGLALAIAARRMPARTAKGSAALSRVRGFRKLFDEGDEDIRARFAEQHGIFAEYLPYAIVFGCAKKWARVFDGLDTAELGTTSWYSGSGTMNSFALASAMDSFGTAATGTLYASQVSSTGSGFSSGSSGFSGGGFSGGGGGGGGGGSW